MGSQPLLPSPPSPEEEVPTAEEIAKNLAGQTVYVGWPHMMEARVVAVSDGVDK